MALLVVLVVVAIATVVTAAVAHRGHLALARSASLLFDDQAMRYVRGAEVWAGQILAADAKRSATDSAHDSWAVGLPPVPIDGGTIAGGLSDLQGRFNLNNLATADEEAFLLHAGRLRRLLGALGLPGDAADAIADWVDADGIPRGRGGAEDDFYSRLDPPYAPANAPFTHLSEVALVRGLGTEALRRLAPYVTVLPGTTAINVNTAPVEVLTMAGLDIAQAERAVDERARTPFTGPADLAARLGLEPDALDTRGLGVASRHFQLAARVEVGGRTVTRFSLLRRSGPGRPAVLQRAQAPF